MRELLIVSVICFWVIICLWIGFSKGTFGALILSIFIMPITILGSNDGHHVGVTSFTTEINLIHVFILITLIFAMLTKSFKFIQYDQILTILAILFGWFILWPSRENVAAGSVHFIFGIISLIVGRYLGRQHERSLSDRWISSVLGIVIGIEFLIVIAQLLGFTVGPFGGASFAGQIIRPAGTFDHPGTLGKFLFVTAILLLPILKSTDRIAKRVSRIIFCMLILMTLISYSRANTVAIVSILAMWMILDKGGFKALPRKMWLVFFTVIMALPFLANFMQRFEVDPDGGERPELFQEALVQLSMTLWQGTGLNNYVEVVGEFGPATAGGFPVHSSLILLVAEAGLVIAACILLPVISIFLKAFGSLSSKNATNWRARALIASIPGVLLITLTGWGMTAGEVYIYWMLVLGFSSAIGDGAEAAKYSEQCSITEKNNLSESMKDLDNRFKQVPRKESKP